MTYGAARQTGDRNPSALKQRRYANQPERVGRRLRIPPKPQPYSSLPGIVALATEKNVLPHVDIALAQAGIYLDSNGHITYVNDQRLVLLATVLGVDIDTLRIAGTPYLQTREKDDGGVAWGRGALKRVDIETRLRRISPLTLKRDSTHRKEWLNLLLPFCPNSLEPLTSRCSNTLCGKALGWNRSMGIGICEYCEQPVQPLGKGLDLDLASNYRLFASLVSPDACEAERAVARLPDPLRALSQSELIMLVLKIGAAVTHPHRNVSRTFYGHLAADQLARIVTEGTSLMRGWPSSVVDTGKRLLEEDNGSVGQFAGFKRVIRSMSPLGSNGRRPFQMFVRDSLPELFSYMSREALADWLPRAKAESLAKIKIEQLTILRDNEAIGLRKIGGREKAFLYSRADLEAFKLAFANSSTTTGLAVRWGLPFYAIEQMLQAKLLETTCDLALATLYPMRRVDLTSVARLENELRKHQSSTRQPDDTVSVPAASSGIGGGFKPWPRIIAQLLKQNVRYWIRDVIPSPRRGAGFLDTILTDQQGAATIRALPADRAAPLDRLSVGDAVEVLNSGWQKVVTLPSSMFVRDKVLRVGGEQRLIHAADLLELARLTVTSREIAARTATHSTSASIRLRRRLQLPENHLGFCRESTERALGLEPRVD